MKNKRKVKRGFEEMRSHYDFSGGVRGKHAKAYAKGTNRVTLDADIAAVFKDEREVNTALRALVDLARKQVPSTRSVRRRQAG
jgi:hypothetical protein